MRVARNRWLVALSLVVTLLASACSGGFSGAVPYTGQPKPSNVPQTVADVLKNDEQQRFTTFLSLVEVANMSDVLTGTGPLTAFAPTNDAIDRAYSPAELQALMQDISGAESFVKSHLTDKDVTFTRPSYVSEVTANGTTQLEVDGKVPLDEAGLVIVTSETPLVMLNNTRVVVFPDKTVTKTAGSSQKVRISEPDIQAPNGFIQVLDGVLTK